METEMTLKDGRIATVRFLDEDDSTRELLGFINTLIREKAYILFDEEFTIKQEENWKRRELDGIRSNESYIISARVDGRLAANSGARKGLHKEKGNVLLGIAVAEGFRGLGLGEALLRLNIETARRFFNPKPRNIYLSVFEGNKPAISLYRKLGFKEFARFPKWALHKGRYIDHIYMKL